jgi:hypothetical protein
MVIDKRFKTDPRERPQVNRDVGRGMNCMKKSIFILMIVAGSYGSQNHLIKLFKDNSTLFAGYSYNYGTPYCCCNNCTIYSNELNIGFGVLSFNKHVEVSGTFGLPVYTNDRKSYNDSGLYLSTERSQSNPVYNDTVRYYNSIYNGKENRICSINGGLTVSLFNILAHCSFYSYLTKDKYHAHQMASTYYRAGDSLVYLYGTGWYDYDDSGIWLSGCLSAGVGYRYKKIDIMVNGFWGDFSGFGIKTNYHFW